MSKGADNEVETRRRLHRSWKWCGISPPERTEHLAVRMAANRWFNAIGTFLLSLLPTPVLLRIVQWAARKHPDEKP